MGGNGGTILGPKLTVREAREVLNRPCLAWLTSISMLSPPPPLKAPVDHDPSPGGTDLFAVATYFLFLFIIGKIK